MNCFTPTFTFRLRSLPHQTKELQHINITKQVYLYQYPACFEILKSKIEFCIYFYLKNINNTSCWL